MFYCVGRGVRGGELWDSLGSRRETKVRCRARRQGCAKVVWCKGCKEPCGGPGWGRLLLQWLLPFGSTVVKCSCLIKAEGLALLLQGRCSLGSVSMG